MKLASNKDYPCDANLEGITV